jgi:hypothetical protein
LTEIPDDEVFQPWVWAGDTGGPASDGAGRDLEFAGQDASAVGYHAETAFHDLVKTVVAVVPASDKIAEF